ATGACSRGTDGWHRSLPLSGDTAKPVHGVTTRAVSDHRNPLESLGEGTSTPPEGRPTWAAQGAKRARGARLEYEGSRRLCRLCLWWTLSTAPWTRCIQATPDGCLHGGRRRCGGAPPSRSSSSERCLRQRPSRCASRSIRAAAAQG